MSVVLKNSGNTGTLHVVDEGTGREFMRFDPTNAAIIVAKGITIIHEDDEAADAPTGKIPLDELLTR